MYKTKVLSHSFLRTSSLKVQSGITTSSKLSKKIDTSSEEYQYLEKSKVPTLHFQKSLPRLPIPELSKTCERYLAAQTPLLNEAELTETTKLTKEFETGIGKTLDEKLRAQDANNKHTSYISGPWFDMYLRDRVPLPLNYNPALVFVNAPADLNKPIIRTTNLIISSLRFMKSLRAGILSPEVFHLNPKKSNTELFRNVVRLLPPAVSWYGAYMFKAYPLDMSQYGNLFNSTRIPRKDKDEIVKDESGRHLVVLRKGHFFKFDVLDKNGNILPPGDIQACLRHILDMNLCLNEESLGVLTGSGRAEWAAAREHIICMDGSNAQAMKDIDSALFAVCLDEEPVGEAATPGMRKFLHGDGFNRWFDKSFSLIVASDGTSGINFEHSWGDGVAVLRYFQDILKDSSTHPFVTDNDTSSKLSATETVSQIKFTLDDSTKQVITKSKMEFDEMCSKLGIDIMELDGFGKKNCKKAKISPDSVMQLAFQVAYHKVYSSFVATYESCSTAAFKHGRTETVRPCTTATRDFALAFNKNNTDDSELVKLMQRCSSVHGQLTKEAAMGNGFDRHLFALRSLAGCDLPGIFTDPAYAKINHNILSTSTLASDAVLMGGFGPVVKDGLGVGYSILDDECGAVVSSYPPNRSGTDFVAALSETLKQFSKLLSKKD